MNLALKEHLDVVYTVAWSPDGHILASGSADHTIRLWDIKDRKCKQILEGHSNDVYSVTWSPNGQIIASSSKDNTIRVWNSITGQEIRVLEGHTNSITRLSFSSDGDLLASKSQDDTVRIWNTVTWETIAVLNGPVSSFLTRGLEFHPNALILATLGGQDRIVQIWTINLDTILRNAPITSFVHYTTAKIALVGDSGVGKSGLGHRIAEGRFLVTESTHGQQFWVVDRLSKIRDDGTHCEAVLWDFAGQPNFRPIHALFLDDIDLALILFDSSRPDTLTGVDYWLKHLLYDQQQGCRTVLVAARVDVSKRSLADSELSKFCNTRKISGGFIETSAKTGTGIEALLDLILRQIDWDNKSATVTTETFKRVKDYVLAIKADVNRANILVSPIQLRAMLEASDSNWHFTDSEMITAVGHLQNHGYVTFLRRSSDEKSILLAPDLLINLAASYMLKAQANEKGLGALEESRALNNEYKFQELENLNEDERRILLSAVTELFLRRNICFRESIDNQTFLIFPSLILERPPYLIEDKDLIEDATYIITGQVENIYPALVVLIGFSSSFQRANHWRKQAQFETARGEVCSFKQTSDEPGILELVLYFGKNIPDFVCRRFQGLFEEILYTRNVKIRKYPSVFCPNCGRQQERKVIIRRIGEGKAFLYSDDDGEKISLPSVQDRTSLLKSDYRIAKDVAHNQMFSKLRTTYEATLVSVKSFIRDRGNHNSPTCFISYAWGVREHERWVMRLAEDLSQAGIRIELDQLNNAAIGSSITRFISRIEQGHYDFIIVVGTLAYFQKYENEVSSSGNIVAAEVDLINVRLTGTEEQKTTILPVLLEGEEATSLPPMLHRRVHGDFRQEKNYFVILFDLVLTIYQIPFDDSIVRDLRIELREEARLL